MKALHALRGLLGNFDDLKIPSRASRVRRIPLIGDYHLEVCLIFDAMVSVLELCT
jgi:hypothetical protein